MEKLERLISDENLELLPDYEEQRLQVLEAMGYIDEQHNVVLKRVACEVNSGWELIITELVLNNFWETLNLQK